jgi:hypothetical protein
MTKKLHSATIKIGKKHYPIKVSDIELKSLADIEKSINERIIDILGKYKDLHLEDALAMILIETHFKMNDSKSTGSPEISKLLDDIEQTIKSVH